MNTRFVGNLGLTLEQEETAIVAFMKALTDGYVSSMYAEPLGPHSKRDVAVEQ